MAQNQNLRKRTLSACWGCGGSSRHGRRPAGASSALSRTSCGPKACRRCCLWRCSCFRSAQSCKVNNRLALTADQGGSIGALAFQARFVSCTMIAGTARKAFSLEHAFTFSQKQLRNLAALRARLCPASHTTSCHRSLWKLGNHCEKQIGLGGFLASGPHQLNLNQTMCNRKICALPLEVSLHSFRNLRAVGNANVPAEGPSRNLRCASQEIYAAFSFQILRKPQFRCQRPTKSSCTTERRRIPRLETSHRQLSETPRERLSQT